MWEVRTRHPESEGKLRSVASWSVKRDLGNWEWIGGFRMWSFILDLYIEPLKDQYK